MRIKLMGEVGMAVQKVYKGNRDNKVHVTSLLLFTEITLLEKQKGCNMYLNNNNKLN